MYCTYCGAKNPDDFNFCRQCGKPRTTAVAASSPVDDPYSQALQGAVTDILEQDKQVLEDNIKKALNTPSKSIEEIMAELKYAAETQVDDGSVERAEKVLKVLIENEGNSVSFLFRHGILAPYETAFAVKEFFRMSRHAQTLPNNQRSSNISVIQRDYTTYIRSGLEDLLRDCTVVDREATTKLLASRGIRIWLEYNLLKSMLQSLSLDRRKVVRDDVGTLNARLGPELTNKLMDYLTNLLNVVRWD